MAEAGDPRRLLEHLPAVGRLHRQDLIDAPLSDNGVALPAQAGVHKQLVHVPKADRAAVDVVLALPRAVVAPCHHDLALIHIKDMGGIVQHQGHLGIARLLPPSGSAEDHILHPAPPESPGGLLPHDPADGIRNIGFS